MTHTELAELATTPEGLRQIDAELATLREAVEVLGRECQLATHAIANFKTKHGPKTYADWAMHVQKRNANPTARAEVETPAQ